MDTDRLYGPLNLDLPILRDLLASRAMQRLQGVLQHGITALIGITHPVSRLEHSLGVMHLVQRFGAGPEEQIAALLHDVSHTAFSHVIDYVFNDHQNQGYHERMKAVYIENSDLPEVLSRHGYDWRDFLHEEPFTLLEQPAPALCADRLDYFLRDSLDLGLANFDEIHVALDSLRVHQGRLVCADLQSARWMADTYLAADQASWANFREVGLYELTAQALRLALQRGLIDQSDLWSTDVQVWEKLHACSDPDLAALLALVSPATRFVWDEANPDLRVATKLRTLDPHVLANGRFASFSELDPAYARRRAAYLQRYSGSWPMRVIKG
ncbi:MAG: HD domain-containing protein [Chloroflexota bacterium]